MWRFLAGAGAALLLAGAGMVWWTSGSDAESPIAAAVQAPPKAGETDTGSGTASALPPRATDRTREEKRFDRYDKDRNQGISTEEYMLSRRKAYAKLDANRDGQLSFDEWAKKTTDKFAKADADKSRELTRAEFATTKVVRKAARRDCPPPRAREQDDDG